MQENHPAWQTKGGRAYGPITNASELQICIDEIKILHEDISGRDKDFQRAKQLMHDAWKIIFLGFGYGEVNVRRLDLAAIDPDKSYSTGVDIHNAELRDIIRRTKGKVNVCRPADCLLLLREWVDWD